MTNIGRGRVNTFFLLQLQALRQQRRLAACAYWLATSTSRPQLEGRTYVGIVIVHVSGLDSEDAATASKLVDLLLLSCRKSGLK